MCGLLTHHKRTFCLPPPSGRSAGLDSVLPSGPDMAQFKQGVKTVAGKMAVLANGVMNTIQVRRGLRSPSCSLPPDQRCELIDLLRLRVRRTATALTDPAAGWAQATGGGANLSPVWSCVTDLGQEGLHEDMDSFTRVKQYSLIVIARLSAFIFIRRKPPGGAVFCNPK